MKTATSRKLLILIIAAVTINQLFGGTNVKIYENFMRREIMILADNPVFTKYAARLYAILKEYISSSIKIDRPVLYCGTKGTCEQSAVQNTCHISSSAIVCACAASQLLLCSRSSSCCLRSFANSSKHHGKRHK
jgi:hypothetical protein